jgi:hypothetical protein
MSRFDGQGIPTLAYIVQGVVVTLARIDVAPS